MKTVTADLIRRYDRPGPRYTSYPTAVEFHEGVGADVYAERLRRASEAVDDPIALYLHLPFCEERCLYCGCNVVITRKREVEEHYLKVLQREIRDVASRLGDRRKVRQYHWGGGTPTYLSPSEMRALQAVVTSELDVEPDAEVAVEIDPRVTTQEHLEAIRELGFNRLSMGVQDFTPEVQREVNRVQPYEDTRDLVERARALGFGSINVDLIYGLPLQNPVSFQRTLELVLQIRPERLAVYSYAHVPWLKVQQRRILEEHLPVPEVKFELIASAVRTFRQAGYLAIGMDHFALPEDELGRALEEGTLWRNFMGYTVRHAPDMVACGMSSIGDVAGAYVQNEKKLIRYEKAVEAGQLAVERGVVLSDDDKLRRHVITAIMCAFHLDFGAVEERFGIDFRSYFREELEALRPMQDDGFLHLHDDHLQVVEEGRLFVRNICMVFDAYLKRARDEKPVFSRTV
jgi:oxygen-independent coproporphyrinogen-3 oxidase